METIFSLNKIGFNNLVAGIGESIGRNFVRESIKKERVSGKHCFYLGKYFFDYRNEYSTDVVEAVKLFPTFPDVTVIKCHPESPPAFFSSDCVGCCEIYQIDPARGFFMGRHRIKDACKKIDEILCYEIKSSASAFRLGYYLTPSQKELIKRVKKLDYVRVYLIKIDLSKFPENIFPIAVEKLS